MFSMEKLEKKMIPVAEKMGKNKYLTTIRDSFAMVMPLLIIGSMFTLVGNFPIPQWLEFVKGASLGDYTVSELLSIVPSCTVAMMAIFVSFAIGYNYADHANISDKFSSGLASLTSWLILMPMYTEFAPGEDAEIIQVASIPFAWVGAKGVFVAIVFGIFAAKIFANIVHRDWTIKMPDGVPPTVSRSFTALGPLTITFLFAWIIRVVFTLTPWVDCFTFIYTFLQTPLQAAGGTVWAEAIIFLFAHLLWFVGIHGTNVTGSVMLPILTALSAENQAALTAGNALPNIINLQFENNFASFGGAGSTLSLLIAALIVCRSKRIRELAKLSLAPGIFQINEPVIFGLPIVLNPVMFIPFLLVPTINILTTYAVMALGLVPICNGVMIPWTTPPIISGLLLCGWQGAVWQLILIAAGVLIYLPFIKALDKQYLQEEAETENVEASDIDSLDLDSLDLSDL